MIEIIGVRFRHQHQSQKPTGTQSVDLFDDINCVCVNGYDNIFASWFCSWKLYRNWISDFLLVIHLSTFHINVCDVNVLDFNELHNWEICCTEHSYEVYIVDSIELFSIVFILYAFNSILSWMFLIIWKKNRQRFLGNNEFHLEINLDKGESINFIKSIGQQHQFLTNISNTLNACYSIQVKYYFYSIYFIIRRHFMNNHNLKMYILPMEMCRWWHSVGQPSCSVYWHYTHFIATFSNKMNFLSKYRVFISYG